MSKQAIALGLMLLAGPLQAGVTVYAAGDIAYCAHPDPRWSGAAETAALVEAGLAADPQAVVLLLGDNVYQRGRASEYRACYHPTWGRFKERTYPSPGNREYATPGARGYFEYFGERAGPGYYAFSLASWRILSLDSNLSGPAQERQLAWLARELEQHPSRCRLAYWHHPLYSSGWHGSNAAMRDAWVLLQRAGVELVLSGHDHTYERFAPQDAFGKKDTERGIRQFVVGTGGSFATPFGWPLAHSEARANNHFGVLKLELGESDYRWEWLEVGDGFPDGRTAERGRDRCH